MSLPDDLKNGIIRQLDSQIAMLKKDFMLWMEGTIGDKVFSFRASDHFAAFSEILKNTEE